MSRDSRNLGPPGKMETGDPLAGTERKEARAKNIGMMECCILACGSEREMGECCIDSILLDKEFKIIRKREKSLHIKI